MNYNSVVLYAYGESHYMEELSEKDFTFVNILGRCRNGLVYCVTRDSQMYSMKVRLKKELKKLPSEITLYHHPCITQIIWIYHNETQLCFLSSYVEATNFMKYIEQRQKKTKILYDEQLCFYAAQLFCVVEHIINSDSYYFDFKPDNVLICMDGNLCVCVQDEGEFLEEFHPPLWKNTHKSYQAPEVLLASPVEDDEEEILHPNKTIFWSIGVFLYKLATGKTPFADTDKKNPERTNILSKTIDFTPFSKPLASLLEKLLQRDPKQRLTDMSLIKSHSFFADIDWNTVCDTQQNKPPFQLTREEVSPSSSVPSPSYASTNHETIDLNPTPTLIAPVLCDELAGHTIINGNFYQ
uniref:Protein kinase domain-containing protein n=1 Tax=Arcella intermedia TaxID=1963864 RepID=A0A6B2L8F6_9EUKA